MLREKVIVRLAEEKDITAIRTLLAMMIPSAFGNGKRGEKFLTWRCTTEEWITQKNAFLRNLIDGEKSAIHVAEIDGIIQGISFIDHDEFSGNFVSKHWRRRWIGSLLMTRGLDSMVSWGYTDAWVGVAEFAEEAQLFYKGCGFKISSYETMDLPPGHNGRATGTEFEVRDLKMELADTAKARDTLTQKLGLGAIAFEDTVEIDLGLLHHIRAFIRRFANRCSTRVRLVAKRLDGWRTLAPIVWQP
ncbi:MAG TPA: GNAT family N-acetyltransferase [Candidatus Saccharimonadales bacterium]